MNEIIDVQSSNPVMFTQTKADLLTQVNLIREVMKSIMKPGIHYGTIPGCPKPSLYKPGSEILLSTFKISVEPEVQDLSTPDEVHYRVLARGIHRDTGTIVGIGIGEASSNEERYKWRKTICEEEFNEAPENRRREKWARGKTGTYKTKQVRTENADLANTVLKMAKKRAQIDLCLTSTACSDIFTQDVEDLPAEYIDQQSGPEKKPVQPPTAKAEAAGDDLIPKCMVCGEAIAKTDDEAAKIISWCNAKFNGIVMCRPCQKMKV